MKRKHRFTDITNMAYRYCVPIERGGESTLNQSSARIKMTYTV